MMIVIKKANAIPEKKLFFAAKNSKLCHFFNGRFKSKER
jgi:hypothetical protein